MKRLAATMALDIRLQYRNGYHLAAAAAALWMLGLARMPEAALDRMLPVFILSNLVLGAFYFMSGLVLAEKRDGTLSMLDVTPLRPHEYLASKVATLVLLSLPANFLIVLTVRGPGFHPLFLALGIAAGGTLLVLAGFLAAARHASLPSFLPASLLHVLVFALPCLPYLGLTEGRWFFYLHPLGAPLLLMEAAFRPLAAWQLAYAAGYSLLWAGIALAAGRGAFARLRRTQARESLAER